MKSLGDNLSVRSRQEDKMHPAQVTGQHIYHIPRTLRQTKLDNTNL